MAQRSKKGKGSYLAYKNENRATKNKIKKLERHIRKFPNDEICKKHLERIKKDGYNPRSKPHVPRVIATVPRAKYIPSTRIRIKTPGEQLRKLLGIPEPTPSKKIKTKITTKKKRNVKT